MSSQEETETFNGAALNPDLLVNVTKKTQTPLSMSMPEMKYAEPGGDVYGFYLADEMRLTWINLSTGATGALENRYSQAARDRRDYAFDVAPAAGFSLSGAVVAVLSTENFAERTTTYADGPSCEPASDGCYASLFFVQAVGVCWRSGWSRSLTLTRRSKRSWTDITLSPVWRLTPTWVFPIPRR